MLGNNICGRGRGQNRPRYAHKLLLHAVGLRCVGQGTVSFARCLYCMDGAFGRSFQRACDILDHTSGGLVGIMLAQDRADCFSSVLDGNDGFCSQVLQHVVWICLGIGFVHLDFCGRNQVMTAGVGQMAKRCASQNLCYCWVSQDRLCIM